MPTRSLSSSAQPNSAVANAIQVQSAAARGLVSAMSAAAMNGSRTSHPSTIRCPPGVRVLDGVAGRWDWAGVPPAGRLPTGHNHSRKQPGSSHRYIKHKYTHREARGEPD
ncbi:hypothetical protein OKW39_001097 [Paraburkholderia sp. MM6662-R1]